MGEFLLQKLTMSLAMLFRVVWDIKRSNSGIMKVHNRNFISDTIVQQNKTGYIQNSLLLKKENKNTSDALTITVHYNIKISQIMDNSSWYCH